MVTQPVRCTPLLPAAWLPAFDKGSSKSVEVQRVWEVYDDPLRFMAKVDDARLATALQEGMFRQPGLFGRLLLSLPWLVLTPLLGPCAWCRARACSWGC